MSDPVLFLTTGGRPEPLLATLASRRWSHVVFICTETEDGLQGSRDLLEAPDGGLVARAGLQDGAWETLVVPPDDLDEIFGRMLMGFGAIRDRHAGRPLHVDYTGGTKSMSAAAVLAATIDGNVGLGLVTGDRHDVVQVRDGTQSARMVSNARIGIERSLALAEDAWRRLAYAEASAAFMAISKRAREAGDSGYANELQVRARIAEGFDSWDKFQHGKAARQLRRLSNERPAHWSAIETLAAQDPTKPSALKLADLWKNAERCGRRQRFDDAVARLYRLTEWTFQWLLDRDEGVDTAKVPVGRLPPGFAVTPEEVVGGTVKLPLRRAWELYRHLRPGSRAAASLLVEETPGRTRFDVLAGYLQSRNSSILAHGHAPVSDHVYSEFRGWCERHMLPLIEEEARRFGDPFGVPDFPLSI
jgi:hypothetical protein